VDDIKFIPFFFIYINNINELSKSHFIMKKFFIFCLSFFTHYLFARNVGIGTTNPSAKLHVNGTLKITNGSQGDGKVLTSDSAGLATWKKPVKSIFKVTGFEAAFNVAPNATRKLTDWKTLELNVDANSLFVNAQGDLFVLKDGFYRVTAKVTALFIDPGDSHNIKLSILINGTKRATYTCPVPTNDNFENLNFQDGCISVTSIFQPDAQDKISFEFYNDATHSNTSARFPLENVGNRYHEFIVEQL
jgi:hypothetical protein